MYQTIEQQDIVPCRPYAPIWTVVFKKDTDKVEKSQQQATEIMTDPEDVTSERSSQRERFVST